MASRDIEVPASPTVAVQGHAVVTDASNYLLTTTPLIVCAGVAIRGQKVAILLHADNATTRHHIETAIRRAVEMDEGTLSVQYICREDERSHYEELMHGLTTPTQNLNATRVASYREGPVVVCMNNREMYMPPNDRNPSPPSGPLYSRLREIVAWNILYNYLEYDQTPRLFGELFLQTIEDVNLAKGEAVNAFRALQPELVTAYGCVDIEWLQTYIPNTKGHANLMTFFQLATLLGQSNYVDQLETLHEMYGNTTIAEGIEDPILKDYIDKYIETSIEYGNEINDFVTSPE